MNDEIYIVPEIYDTFAAWLDRLLEDNEMPENTVAFNFNLYDEADPDVYAIQLAATERFDPDDKDGDWACFMAWYSEDDLYCLDFSDDKDKGFEYVQGIFAAFVKNYLEVEKHRDILLASRGIGIGHVDGDLEILYINRDTVL